MSQVLMRASTTPWGKKIPAGVVPSHTPYTLDFSNSVLVAQGDVDTLRRHGFEVVGAAGLSSGSSQSGVGASNELLVSRNVLTASEINHLHSSPKTLIEAPGAGLVIVPLRVAVHLKVGSIFFGYFDAANVTAGIHYSGSESPPLAVAGFDEATAPLLTSAVDVSSLLNASEMKNPGSVLSNRSVLLSNLHLDYSTFGAIATLTIADGGADYVESDTGTIASSDGNELATYEVVTQVEGAATELSITTNPGGYEVESGLSTTATSGTGTGLEIDVTGVTPGNGQAVVAIYYNVLDVGI